eukprot:m.396034 g.396034  ORF g.396034 m.396034 type:complete len:88 (-) comp21107_c0_seq1:1770-2033(-)
MPTIETHASKFIDVGLDMTHPFCNELDGVCSTIIALCSAVAFLLTDTQMHAAHRGQASTSANALHKVATTMQEVDDEEEEFDWDSIM